MKDRSSVLCCTGIVLESQIKRIERLENRGFTVVRSAGISNKENWKWLCCLLKLYFLRYESQIKRIESEWSRGRKSSRRYESQIKRIESHSSFSFWTSASFWISNKENWKDSLKMSAWGGGSMESQIKRIERYVISSISISRMVMNLK